MTNLDALILIVITISLRVNRFENQNIHLKIHLKLFKIPDFLGKSGILRRM